jgi:molybdenum cofactor cytidylyltransferase
VVVVLGALADRLQTELAGLPVIIALNPAWESGMASSIRAGLGAAAADAPGLDAVVILLCDQPLITAAMLDRLVAVHRAEGRGIVAAEYGEAAGVPALFGRNYFPGLGALEGDQGARKIIVNHNKDLARIPMPEAAFDVDRHEEAARLEALASQ